MAGDHAPLAWDHFSREVEIPHQLLFAASTNHTFRIARDYMHGFIESQESRAAAEEASGGACDESACVKAPKNCRPHENSLPVGIFEVTAVSRSVTELRRRC